MFPGGMSGYKRPRRDSDARGNTEFEPTAGGSAWQPRRDAEFWFEDGSVILIARNIEFRIFKGILADYSPVFRDMFSLPQPSSMLEGAATETNTCPVVHLSDSPEDLRHVLRICMPKSDSTFDPFTPNAPFPSFHMVSAVIRLGHKYQMQKMVARAVDYLKRWFSDDFDAWSAGRLYEPGAPLRCMHAIGVVNLARLVDEPSLLPTALLVCCTLDERIVEGVAREDGILETLALGDIGRCFAARRRMAEKSLILAMRIFNPDVAYECEDRSRCERALRAILLSVEDRSESFASPDVFPSWLDPMGERGLLSECCRDCYEMLERRDRQERLEVWRELPGIMRVDVDGWAANVRWGTQ